MAEYIERERLLKKFCTHCYGEDTCDTDCMDIRIIKSIPSADVVPVKHGKWIKNEGIGCRGVGWHCSVCKENDVWAFLDKSEKTQDDLYCPNCGAKMDGEE